MKQQFNKIQKMQKQELLEFSREVSLANLDKTSQTFLFRAIEIRISKLENEFGVMIVESEIDSDGGI